MPFSLIPRGVYPAVTQISPKALAEKGVRLVLADLDNTLVPYKETEPTRAVRTWKDALAAEGITLFLLSNSRKPGRPHGFAQKLDIPCIGHAGKPKREGFFRAMERMGRRPEETVMVGDNFTHDIQGALDVGIDGVWLNWTDKPKPVGELSYTEVSTFEQAAAHIRTLL